MLEFAGRFNGRGGTNTEAAMVALFAFANSTSFVRKPYFDGPRPEFSNLSTFDVLVLFAHINWGIDKKVIEFLPPF